MAETGIGLAGRHRFLLLAGKEDGPVKTWESLYIVFCTLGMFLLVGVQELRVRAAEQRAERAEGWVETVEIEAQMWLEKR